MGKEEFVGAFENAFGRLQVALLEACDEAEDWPQSLAIGIHAALELAAADPDVARTLTSEAMAQGVDGVDRYERLVAYLREQLEPGRRQMVEDDELPRVIEHALASGVLMLVAQRVDQGRAAELPALAPEVTQFVLTPYLGSSEARRVANETKRS